MSATAENNRKKLQKNRMQPPMSEPDTSRSVLGAALLISQSAGYRNSSGIITAHLTTELGDVMMTNYAFYDTLRKRSRLRTPPPLCLSPSSYARTLDSRANDGTVIVYLITNFLFYLTVKFSLLRTVTSSSLLAHTLPDLGNLKSKGIYYYYYYYYYY